jgi:hypothetical protein
MMRSERAMRTGREHGLAACADDQRWPFFASVSAGSIRVAPGAFLDSAVERTTR